MNQANNSATLLALSISRPIATMMLFVAIAMVGLYAWVKMPVELLPAVSGDQLFVNFYRPGADPEVVERDILKPIEARTRQLPGVVRTWAEVSGSGGTFNIEFEAGSNYRIRELELRRMAASLQRQQPEGTRIRVSSQDTTALSRFVMNIQIIGGDDVNVIRDLVDKRIRPQIEATPGVGRVLVFGGARRELTIEIDVDKAAQFGITSNEIAARLRQVTQGLQYLGGVEQYGQRKLLIVDDRPTAIEQLNKLRIRDELPVQLGAIAEISLANEPRRSVSRVNGQQAVSMMVLQQQGGNLVELGEKLHHKLADLRRQYQPYGIDFTVSFDAAEQVDEQLEHLKQLALSGFLIALVVLVLFLKDLRAASVVAIAVPVSLLAAGAMLYLGGYSLNLITLFGLVIGIGMLVDNSIVVYESVQRSLEKGTQPDLAVVLGVRRTLRAILTASATNAIVFFPLLYLNDIPILVSNLIGNIVPAIVYPLTASLLVAIGLVPLLTYRLAAPAAVKKRQVQIKQRQLLGATPPNVAQQMFSGVVKNALRKPAPLLASTIVSVLVTVVVALPWVLVQTISQQATDEQQVRVEVELNTGGSLEAASVVFEQLEFAALKFEGISTVQSNYDELQGTLTVNLLDAEERPEDVDAPRVRRAINSAVARLSNVQVKPIGTLAGNNENSDSLANQATLIGIAGADMRQLDLMAKQLKQRLSGVPYVSAVNLIQGKAVSELHVVADAHAMATYHLMAGDVYATLFGIGREGVRLPQGFYLPDGNEVSIVLRRMEKATDGSVNQVARLPINTGNGVLELSDVVATEQNIPPIPISHYNGRREIRLSYQLDDNAPKSGPDRLDLERQINQAIEAIYQPPGYTVETINTGNDQDWLKFVILPVILLLYALLAIALESLTLPLLILIAVPLTVLGAVWALVVSGLGLDMMAGVGAIVLLGLTVNPAILMVDRMQQKRRNGGCSIGKAAMSAALERVRPVLMTSCTTIAGLWPLAISKGQALELWPPFATIVIGGLAVSTLLTLLMVPIGYVLLARIDNGITRLGLVRLAIIAALSAALVGVPLMLQITSDILWSAVAFVAVFIALGYGYLRIFAHQQTVLPDTEDMQLETRYLTKIYNQSGPVLTAWNKYRAFTQQHPLASVVLLRQRVIVQFFMVIAAGLLTINIQTPFWQLLCGMLAGFFVSQILLQVKLLQYVYRNRQNPKQQSLKPQSLRQLSDEAHSSNDIEQHYCHDSNKGFERALALLTPWAVLLVMYFYLSGSEVLLIVTAVLIAIAQLGRNTARQIADGKIKKDAGTGVVNLFKGWWRSLCADLFSIGLSQPAFCALNGVSFTVGKGMTGVLGPNGAGKTTLFRLVSTVLDSSCGTIYYANCERRTLGREIAQLVGFLPQEFGLPGHLSAKEYLEYFAILYRIGDKHQRQARVEHLLAEVGLTDKQDARIDSYSGGMRQRVAVARTLLSGPPVILVDEPTAGLDPRERIRFRNLLARLAKTRVVLFSTHIVEDVAVACEQVLVIKRGKLIYQGSPDDLAQLADEQIWSLTVDAQQAAQFEQSHNVINTVVQSDGLINLRIMAGSQPHPQALACDATLEDGYMHLFANKT